MMSISSPIPERRQWPQRLKLTSRSALSPYDHFVALMRLVLPFVAIIIGLIALAWPLLSDTEDGFTFRREGLETHSDKIRIENAHYTGVDSYGRLFYVSARQATQDRPDAPLVDLTLLEAELDADAEERAHVTAPAGLYAIEERRLAVTGGMSLDTSSGYHVRTDRATIALDKRVAQSDSVVDGRSPLGSFRAGGFTLYAENRVMRLRNGVSMTINPDAVAEAIEP